MRRHFIEDVALGFGVAMLLTAAVSFAQSSWYEPDAQTQQQLDQIQRQHQQHENNQWFRDEELKRNSRWPC